MEMFKNKVHKCGCEYQITNKDPPITAERKKECCDDIKYKYSIYCDYCSTNFDDAKCCTSLTKDEIYKYP